MSDDEVAEELRRVADRLDDSQEAAPDGGSVANRRAEQVPDGPEVDVLARIWPLSARMTMLGGVLLVGWAATSMRLEMAVLGLAVLGGAVELAKSEGRREESSRAERR